jgi:predicted metal-dependent hydrolase
MLQGRFIIQDSELGEVLLRPDSRAIRFSFRVKEGQLVCSYPLDASRQEFFRALEHLKPRLLRMLQCAQERTPTRLIEPGFRIEAEAFTFRMEESRVSRLTMRQRQGELVCHYPAGQDFSPRHVQKWLVQMIEESLREHARVLLAPRLRAMAEARGLSYKALSIHKTKGRWGSCSSQKNINLSLYLMLLPHHLQDYVMQHELTHLVEMNHGPRFHALLDEALGGRSAQYERELQKYDIDVFSLGSNAGKGGGE